MHVSTDIQPDKGVVQAIDSIRSNPKFKRLLNFQLNTLVGYLTPPNPKFHENGLYVLKAEGHVLIIQALQNFTSDDSIVLNASMTMRRLVGHSNNRDETILQTLIKADSINAINSTLCDETYTPTKETFKELLALINDFILNPAVAANMIEQNTLESLIGALGKDSIQDSSVLQGFETLSAFLSFPSNLNKAILQDILPQFCQVLQMTSLSPVTVAAGFRIIQKIMGSPLGFEYVKKCDIIRIIVGILSSFPSDKTLSSLGSSILGKIINEDTISAALCDLKKQSGDLIFQSALLSNLVLASDKMESLIEKGEVLREVLGLMSRLKDSTDDEQNASTVLRNCFVTLQRIASVSSKQAKTILSDSSLDIISEFLECDNPNIFIAVLDTFNLLLNIQESTLDILTSKGIIKTLLDFANTVHADNILTARSLVSFLGNIASQRGGLACLISTNSIYLLIKIFKIGSKFKIIAETAIKILSMLATHPQSAKPLSQKIFLEQIVEVCNNRPEWRRYCWNSLRCLCELLNRSSSLVEEYNKLELIETLVSIISKKAYVLILNSKTADALEEESSDIYEDQNSEELSLLRRENKEKEEFSESTEKEILSKSLLLLSHLASIEEVMSTSEQLEAVYEQLSSSTDDQECGILLEMSLYKLALGIVAFGQESLEMGVHSFALTLGKRIFKELPQSASRSDILSVLCDFFVLTSQLFEEDETQQQFISNRFFEVFIEQTEQGLAETQKPQTLRIYLSALLRLVTRVNPNKPTLRLLQKDTQNKKTKQNSYSTAQVTKIVSKALRQDILSDFSLIKMILMNLQTLYSINQDEMSQILIEDGAIKFIIDYINLFLDVDLGMECLRFFQAAVSSSDSVAVVSYLAKLRTLQILTSYISSMNGNQALRTAAQPILEKLSQYEIDHPDLQQKQQRSGYNNSNISQFQRNKFVNQSLSAEIRNNESKLQQKQQTQNTALQQQSADKSKLLVSSKKEGGSTGNIAPATTTIKTNIISEKSLEDDKQEGEQGDESRMKQLINTIDPESNYNRSSTIFSLKICSETLEQIQMEGIIDRGLDILLRVGLMQALNNLLGYINVKDENDLAISGELFVSERLIIGSLQMIIRVLISEIPSKQHACNEIYDNCDGLFLKKILYLLKQKSRSPLILSNTIQLIQQFMKEPSLVSPTIALMNSEKHCQTLTNLVQELDQIPEFADTQHHIIKLIITIAQASVESVKNLGTNEFIRWLLRRIRSFCSSIVAEEILCLYESIQLTLALCESPAICDVIINDSTSVDTLLLTLRSAYSDTISLEISKIFNKLRLQQSFAQIRSQEFLNSALSSLVSKDYTKGNISEMQLTSILNVISSLVPLPKSIQQQSKEVIQKTEQILLNLQATHCENKTVRDICASILSVIGSVSQVDSKATLQNTKQTLLGLSLTSSSIQDILLNIKKVIAASAVVVSSQESSAQVVKAGDTKLSENTKLISKLESFLGSPEKDIIKSTLSLLSTLSLEGPETQKEILESNIIPLLIKKVIPLYKQDNSFLELAFDSLNSILHYLDDQETLQLVISTPSNLSKLELKFPKKNLVNLQKNLSTAQIGKDLTELCCTSSVKVSSKILQFLSTIHRFVGEQFLDEQRLLERSNDLVSTTKSSEFFEIASSAAAFSSNLIHSSEQFEKLIVKILENPGLVDDEDNKSTEFGLNYFRMSRKLIQNAQDKGFLMKIGLVDKILAGIKSLLGNRSLWTSPSSIPLIIQVFDCLSVVENDQSTARAFGMTENGPQTVLSVLDKVKQLIEGNSEILEPISITLALISSHKSQIQSLEPWKSSSLLNSFFKYLLQLPYLLQPKNNLISQDAQNQIVKNILYALKECFVNVPTSETQEIYNLIGKIKKSYSEQQDILKLSSEIDTLIEKGTQTLSSDIDLSQYLSKETINIDDLTSILKLIDSSYSSASTPTRTSLLSALNSLVSKYCTDVEKAQQLQTIGLAEALVSACNECLPKETTKGVVVAADKNQISIDISLQMELILKCLNFVYEYPRVVQKSKVVAGVIKFISQYLTCLFASVQAAEIVKRLSSFNWCCVILGYAGPFPSALQLIYETSIVHDLIAITKHLLSGCVSKTKGDEATQIFEVCAVSLETLAKISSSKVIAEQFLNESGKILLKDVLENSDIQEQKHLYQTQLLSSACYALGKVSQNSVIQGQFYDLSPLVIKTMHQAQKQNCLSLWIKCTFSLASLAFNNETSSVKLLQDQPDLANHLIETGTNNMKESELLSNICMLINSICYKNAETKKIIGQNSKAIKFLLTIAKDLASNKTTSDSKNDSSSNNETNKSASVKSTTSPVTTLDSTIQQALKTIGNLSLYEQNSLTILREGLLDAVEEIFEHKYSSNKELSVFSIDILLNTCAVLKKDESLKDDFINTITIQPLFERLVKYIEKGDSDIKRVAVEIISCTIYSPLPCGQFLMLNGVTTLAGLIALKTELATLVNILRILQSISQVCATQGALQMQANNIAGLLVPLISSIKDSKFLSKALKVLSFLGKQIPESFNDIEQDIVGLINSIDITSLENGVLKEYLILVQQLVSKDEIALAVVQKLLSPLQASLHDKIEDAELVDVTIDIIEKVALKKQTNKQILSTGCLAFLCEVLKKYLTKQSSTQKVLRCLEILSSTGESNQQAVASGCLQLLEKLMKETQKVPELYKMIASSKQSIQKGTSAANRPSLITQELKDFVLTGTLCKLYKSNGTSSKLMVFITPDFMEVNCRKENKVAVKPKWKMSINMIQQIKSNYDTDTTAFNKSCFSFTFRKKADPQTCLAIIGPPQASGRKSFFIQCGSKEEKDKWVKYLNDLSQEAQENKKVLQVMF